MRTKKIALNILADTIPYLLIGIVGIIKVRVLIDYIGDTGNGYYQFINQVISYVFLAQCGFVDAVIFKLYKPFADNNKDDINAIYSGSRKIFKRIGLIIFGIILLVTAGLYMFGNIEAEYRFSSLFCFFVISVSYLIPFFVKKQAYQAVVSAAQERYTFSFITNIIKLICDVSIIGVIILFRNLESIAITILIVKIIEEIVVIYFIEKKYPWLKDIERKDTSATKMIKDLAWYQIGYLITNNTDSILVMTFLGPLYVSIYTSYNFILRFLNEIIARINSGTIYSFGNVFAKKEDKLAYPLYKEYLSGFIIIGFITAITFMLGIRPFVDVWIKNSDYLLSYTSIVLFTSTMFFTTIYFPLYSMINSNGLFKENKNHVMISAIINVVLSLALIIPYGMNGLLFGTVLALVVNIILKIFLASSKIFKEENIIKLLMPYVITSVIFVIISILLNNVELFILNNTHGLINTLLVIFGIFIIVSILTILIMTIIDSNTRLLIKRATNLLKRKKRT